MDGSGGFYGYNNYYSQQGNGNSGNNMDGSHNQGYGDYSGSQYTVEPTPFPPANQGQDTSMYQSGTSYSAAPSSYNDYSAASALNASYPNSLYADYNASGYSTSDYAQALAPSNALSSLTSAFGNPAPAPLNSWRQTAQAPATSYAQSNSSLSNDILGYLVGAGSHAHNSYNSQTTYGQSLGDALGSGMSAAPSSISGANIASLFGSGASQNAPATATDPYSTLLQDAVDLLAPTPVRRTGANKSNNPVPAPAPATKAQPAPAPPPANYNSSDYARPSSTAQAPLPPNADDATYMKSTPAYSAPPSAGNNATGGAPTAGNYSLPSNTQATTDTDVHSASNKRKKGKKSKGSYSSSPAPSAAQDMSKSATTDYMSYMDGSKQENNQANNYGSTQGAGTLSNNAYGDANSGMNYSNSSEAPGYGGTPSESGYGTTADSGYGVAQSRPGYGIAADSSYADANTKANYGGPNSEFDYGGADSKIGYTDSTNDNTYAGYSAPAPVIANNSDNTYGNFSTRKSTGGNNDGNNGNNDGNNGNNDGNYGHPSSAAQGGSAVENNMSNFSSLATTERGNNDNMYGTYSAPSPNDAPTKGNTYKSLKDDTSRGHAARSSTGGSMNENGFEAYSTSSTSRGMSDSNAPDGFSSTVPQSQNTNGNTIDEVNFGNYSGPPSGTRQAETSNYDNSAYNNFAAGGNDTKDNSTYSQPDALSTNRNGDKSSSVSAVYPDYSSTDQSTTFNKPFDSNAYDSYSTTKLTDPVNKQVDNSSYSNDSYRGYSRQDSGVDESNSYGRHKLTSANEDGKNDLDNKGYGGHPTSTPSEHSTAEKGLGHQHVPPSGAGTIHNDNYTPSSSVPAGSNAAPNWDTTGNNSSLNDQSASDARKKSSSSSVYEAMSSYTGSCQGSDSTPNLDNERNNTSGRLSTPAPAPKKKRPRKNKASLGLTSMETSQGVTSDFSSGVNPNQFETGKHSTAISSNFQNQTSGQGGVFAMIGASQDSGQSQPSLFSAPALLGQAGAGASMKVPPLPPLRAVQPKAGKGQLDDSSLKGRNLLDNASSQITDGATFEGDLGTAIGTGLVNSQMQTSTTSQTYASSLESDAGKDHLPHTGESSLGVTNPPKQPTREVSTEADKNKISQEPTCEATASSLEASPRPAEPSGPGPDSESVPKTPPPPPKEWTKAELVSLLTKCEIKKYIPPSKTSKTPVKCIEIPSQFSPTQSFRAAAVYSLLRTLSQELRLSPFSLKSFLQALVLPMPSRLLGEIHVRVLRILFANIGIGTYSIRGEGSIDALYRKVLLRATEQASSKPSKVGSANSYANPEKPAFAEIIVPKRGSDNLFFLDNATWPLFYEDYAIATEERFLQELDDGDNFIDCRSAAMQPMDEIHLNPKPHEHFISRNLFSPTGSPIISSSDPKPPALVPGPGWFCRCPAGPAGLRNPAGRFVCCPFHISAAIRLAEQTRPPSPSQLSEPCVPSKPDPAPEPQIPPRRKRGRPKGSKNSKTLKKTPKKLKAKISRPLPKPKKKSHSVFSDESSDDDFDEDDEEFRPTTKAASPKRKTKPKVKKERDGNINSTSTRLHDSMVFEVEFAISSTRTKSIFLNHKLKASRSVVEKTPSYKNSESISSSLPSGPLASPSAPTCSVPGSAVISVEPAAAMKHIATNTSLNPSLTPTNTKLSLKGAAVASHVSSTSSTHSTSKSANDNCNTSPNSARSDIVTPRALKREPDPSTVKLEPETSGVTTSTIKPGSGVAREVAVVKTEAVTTASPTVINNEETKVETSTGKNTTVTEISDMAKPQREANKFEDHVGINSETNLPSIESKGTSNTIRLTTTASDTIGTVRHPTGVKTADTEENSCHLKSLDTSGTGALKPPPPQQQKTSTKSISSPSSRDTLNAAQPLKSPQATGSIASNELASAVAQQLEPPHEKESEASRKQGASVTNVSARGTNSQAVNPPITLTAISPMKTQDYTCPSGVPQNKAVVEERSWPHVFVPPIPHPQPNEDSLPVSETTNSLLEHYFFDLRSCSTSLNLEKSKETPKEVIDTMDYLIRKVLERKPAYVPRNKKPKKKSSLKNFKGKLSLKQTGSPVKVKKGLTKTPNKTGKLAKGPHGLAKASKQRSPLEAGNLRMDRPGRSPVEAGPNPASMLPETNQPSFGAEKLHDKGNTITSDEAQILNPAPTYELSIDVHRNETKFVSPQPTLSASEAMALKGQTTQQKMMTQLGERGVAVQKARQFSADETSDAQKHTPLPTSGQIIATVKHVATPNYLSSSVPKSLLSSGSCALYEHTNPPSVDGVVAAGEHKGQGHIRTPIRPGMDLRDHAKTAFASQGPLSHMLPLKYLKKGIPYHHLSLSAKLEVLEFLLDDLLAVEDISNELSRRSAVTDCYVDPFGQVPLPDEFDTMENSDECTICGMEGDLLCCDGCPNSYHRMCLNMGNGRLPDGKWLCPECKLADVSRMGPFGSDRRPLLGWFTINDIAPALVRSALGIDSSNLSNNRSALGFVENLPTYDNALVKSTNGVAGANFLPLNNVVAKTQVNIPENVEFLVTAGLVFARHRLTHHPYDPFNAPEPKWDPFGTLTKYAAPPVALDNRQLAKVLYLLGPEFSFVLPWRHINFDPCKVWKENEATVSLQPLIKHQIEVKSIATSNFEMHNPFMYMNTYRRAPPPPILKAHQGTFIYPALLPDIVNYPAKVGGLSSASLDPTEEQSSNIRLSYCDPIQSIRDKMIRIQKSLCDACLLDVKWGTWDGGMDEDAWRSKVEVCNSIKKLSRLLVELVDACCSRAFYNQWNEVRDDGFTDDTDRLLSFDEYTGLYPISAGWSPNKEVTRRKWERATSSDLLRLLSKEGALFEDSSSNKDSPKKRGKRRSTAEGEVPSEPVGKVASPQDENTPQPHDRAADDAVVNPTDENENRRKPKVLDKQSNDVSVSSPNEKNLNATVTTEIETTRDEGKAPDPRRNGDAKLSPKSSKQGTTSSPKLKLVGGKESGSKATDDAKKPVESLDADKPNDQQALPKINLKSFTQAKKSPKSPQRNGSELSKSSARSKSNSVSKDYLKKTRMRIRGCGKCDICVQEDCRECVFCLDMKKYGGANKLRQKCQKRKACPFRESIKSQLQNMDAGLQIISVDSSKKRRAQKDSSGTPSRRRSDRLNVVRDQIQSLLGIEDFNSMSNVDRGIAEAKIDKLEQLLANADTNEAYWSIAGKKLFEPKGSLPRPVSRRLARNAGSCRAPSIAYETSYEVGETTTCHHWRKRTLNCNTYEDMFLCLKFLDAHIDKAVTLSCGTLASRKAHAKSNAVTAVRCVCVDPMTGIKEYFVVPTGKTRGSWQSESKIDLSSFIQYRFDRKKSYREKKLQKDRLRKAKQTQAKKKKEMEIRKKEIEARKKEAEKRKAEAAKRRKELDEKRRHEAKLKAEQQAKRKGPSGMHRKESAKRPKSDYLVKRHESEFRAAVHSHRTETKDLLKESARRGQSCVPTDAMTQVRMKNMSAMKAANIAMQEAGGKRYSEKEFTNHLAMAEAEAVKLYVEEMNKEKILTKSMGPPLQHTKRDLETATYDETKDEKVFSRSQDNKQELVERNDPNNDPMKSPALISAHSGNQPSNYRNNLSVSSVDKSSPRQAASVPLPPNASKSKKKETKSWARNRDGTSLAVHGGGDSSVRQSYPSQLTPSTGDADHQAERMRLPYQQPSYTTGDVGNTMRGTYFTHHSPSPADASKETRNVHPTHQPSPSNTAQGGTSSVMLDSYRIHQPSLPSDQANYQSRQSPLTAGRGGPESVKIDSHQSHQSPLPGESGQDNSDTINSSKYSSSMYSQSINSNHFYGNYLSQQYMQERNAPQSSHTTASGTNQTDMYPQSKSQSEYSYYADQTTNGQYYGV